MDKHDHVQYWKISAEKTMVLTRHLFATAFYVDCLFHAHLTIEKLLKAHWVKDNVGNVPPKIHNLRKLAEQTQLALSNAEIAFLDSLNPFQIDGRYPDFNFRIYQQFDEPTTKTWLDQTENLYQCLLVNLP